MTGPSSRPLWCLLLVGGIAGTIMAFAVPRFAGIDEPYHYVRAWSISDGELMADSGALPGDATGGGTCVPTAVLDELFAEREPYIEQLLPDWDGRDPLFTSRCPDGEGGRFVDLATYSWYSPVGYVGPVIGVATGRFLGFGVATQALLARLASLAVYLAMCALAVRWAPRARWALVVVALIPASLFQAVTSLSPDGFTIGAVLLVVASALRAADRTLDLSTRRLVAEASVASLALALAKPTYIVVVGCYVVVLLGRKESRRFARWPVLIPAVAAVGVSVVWNATFRDLFVCDVRYFGIGTDPDGQIDRLVRRPWRAITASGQAFVDHGRRWVRDAATIGERVVPWGFAASAAVVGGLVAVGLVPDRVEESRRGELTGWQRAAFVGVGLATVVAVLTGWMISCGPPGLEVDNPPHARLLIPALAPILAGLSWPGRGRFRPRLPLATILLAAGYAGWIAVMIDTMR
jgi:hypothetical protein